MTERSLSLATLVRSGSGGKNRPPLVVLLHGYGSNEEDLFSLERFVPPECVVVSVRAPLALAHGAYAWFSLRVEAGKPVGDKHEAEEARHIFREFLAQALIKYDADPSRVILIGFSQGAIVSASTLLTFSEDVSAIAMLSGRILHEIRANVERIDALREKRVFIGHGTDDEVLPVSYARESKTYLESLGIVPEYHEYAIGHSVSKEESDDLARWVRSVLDERDVG